VSSSVFYESSSEQATVRNIFKVAGTATDPTAVSLTVTTPAGVSTTYTYAAAEITKNTTGDYQKLIACSEDGDWIAVWVGTGAAADVQVSRWQVFSTGNLYCSVESLKSRFGISDTADDYELERAVRAASRRIESYCGRERFWRDSAVTIREFEADDTRCCRVPEGISTSTGLVVKTDEDGDGTYERTLTIATDFLLKPLNATSKNPAWPYDEIVLADNYSFPVHRNGRPGVQVTARFGWPEIPDDIREAALILAHRLFKRKETASGVVGFDGAGVTVRLARTDPDVAELLSPYVVIAVA
jgi:hypothetical protein